MTVVRGLYKPTWLKMNRSSKMSPLTPSRSKVCTRACRKYRYLKKFAYVLQIQKSPQHVTDPEFNVCLQCLRQETEFLWSDYANQCTQLSGNAGLEQEMAELQEQWRGQQSSLQRRGSSLGAALRQIDSTENHMVDFTDRLDRYLRQPKDISAFTLASTNILKDIKVHR